MSSIDSIISRLRNSVYGEDMRNAIVDLALNSEGTVHYDTAQEDLTDAQKAQARTNIDAASPTEIQSAFEASGMFTGLLKRVDGTSNNVRFAWSGNVCTVTLTSGTATTGVCQNVLLSTRPLPSFLKPGDKVYIRYTTTDANVRFGIIWLNSSNSPDYRYYTEDTVIEVPATAVQWAVRLHITSGAAINSPVTATVAGIYSEFSHVGIGQTIEDTIMANHGTAISGIVQYNAAQSLTNVFKEQARENIGSASVADVGKVGTVIEYNNLFPMISGEYGTNITRNGITISYNSEQDAFDINGTATAQVLYRIVPQDGEKPQFIERGTPYYLRYSSTDTSIRFRVGVERSGSWTYTYYTSDGYVNIPDSATNYIINLVVANGATVNHAAVVARLENVEPEHESSALNNAVEIYTKLESQNGWWLANGTVDSVATHKHSQPLPVRPDTNYYFGYCIDGYDCDGMFYNKYKMPIAPLLRSDVTEYTYKKPDGTETAGSANYVKLYTFKTPKGAAYFSYNHSTLSQYAYRSYVASKPVFATPLYGDLVIRKDDPAYMKHSDRKLCIIGTSQIMTDRLYRTGNFDGPDGGETSQYVSGCPEYLIPWWHTVDCYGYSSAAMMYKADESPKSIYTRVVTDQLDLSGYDDVFITHSTSGLTDATIGDVNSYSDIGENTTYIGALRQIIDYVYSQNPNARIFVQTRIIRTTFNSDTTYQRVITLNERIRKLAKMLAVEIVDTAQKSGFNYYVAPYWCYDALGHPNHLGNYFFGLSMRKDMLGF